MNQKKHRNITVLVTGCAGFIGFHLTRYLLELGIPVVGVDNLNSYYDVALKKARLKFLEKDSFNLSVPFEFHKIDIEDFEQFDKVFRSNTCSNKFRYSNANFISSQLQIQNHHQISVLVHHHILTSIVFYKPYQDRNHLNIE